MDKKNTALGDISIGSALSELLRLLAGSWTLEVLACITEGEKRFGEIKRVVDGISSRMLSDRLARMVAAGFLHRERKMSTPPEVSYSLTAKGKELVARVNDLGKQAKEWERE